ncbi:Golgi transport complex subunit 4 [Entomophthora muscae]|uniref:Golgi transport complex subunit 4 n=2 Tax=Entomophthora muscae TaxID=34485 RepID=A0ACC2S447_9FUNG|nr:Golgi transport complex subunit 4 [Entomophthora muscae]
MFDVKKNIAEASKSAYEASNQVAFYASEQLKVADSIKLLKETQLLQNHLERLHEAHASGDFEACLEHCHQYITLDFEAVSRSPFGRFLLPGSKEAPQAKFESIRQELVSQLTEQMKELASGMEEAKPETYNKLIDMVKRFSLVGEQELGVSFLSSYIIKMLNETASSILANQSDDFPGKLRIILEDSSRVVMETKELLFSRFDKPWFKVVVDEIVKNADMTLDRFQRAYSNHRQLPAQLEKIHASFQLPTSNQGSEINVRELDHILTEIAAIAQKLHLFRRLVTSALDLSLVGESLQGVLDAFPIIEKFYLARSVAKALELDEYQEGSSHSSSVDDVLYLIKKGSFRSLTSCDPSIFRNSVLIYVSCLKDLLSSMPESSSSLKECLISINNASACVSYINRLVTDLNDAVIRTLSAAGFSQEIQQQFLESIAMLPKLAASFKDRRQISLRRLLDKGVAPKIQAFFSQMSSESVYLKSTAATPITTKFTSRFEHFLSPFKENLSDDNFSWFIEEVSKVVGASLGQFILNQKYDQMGALSIASDVDIVKGYFSSQTEGYVKDAFARPVAMANLLECQSLGEAKEFVEDPSFPSQLFESEELKILFASKLEFSA